MPALSPAASQPAARAPSPIRRDAANAARPPIVVGALNFPEQALLGQLYAQALRAAGYRVGTRLAFGSDAAALASLRAGRIDALPEYLGVLLGGRGPHTRTAAYAQVRARMARRGIAVLAPTPFQDAPGFAMARATAGAVRSLSDLRARAPGLVLAGPPGCRTRLDCARGLARVYGLRFRRVLSVPAADRIRVLRSGRADVSTVSTTDGALAAGDLVLLRDDRDLLAPYHVSLLVGDRTLRAAGPGLLAALDRLQPTLTTLELQRLNARLERGQPPARVAAQHLRESGLVR